MSVYFWIGIPVELFFRHCNESMEKHGVSAYIEMTGDALSERNYVKYSKENASDVMECFSSSDYQGFFFSTYPFQENLVSGESVYSTIRP